MLLLSVVMFFFVLFLFVCLFVCLLVDFKLKGGLLAAIFLLVCWL